MPESISSRDQYSSFTGFIYIFNIIVGTGALTIPGAFSKAGWCLGTGLVATIAFFGYMTVTFVVESLSVVNAISYEKRKKNGERNIQDENHSAENTPLFADETEDNENLFDIREKFEIGEMATVLLEKPYRIIIYVCLSVYLYGDLAIYCAVVATTMTRVSCTYTDVNFSCNSTISDRLLCWENLPLTRLDAHRMYILLFVLIMGPFTFFNVQKTKFLQLFTSLMRWSAFVIMICWSIQKLFVNGVNGHPPIVNPYLIPALFGASVYSFMCHHSVPSLTHPIENKSKLLTLITTDYVIITLFYLLLSLTASFTFKSVNPLYTLNFWTDDCQHSRSIFANILSYFLALFPVFALSTSYPIIAITLRNNLRYIFQKSNDEIVTDDIFRKLFYPLIVIIPPTIISLTVTNLETLVGVIGSYAGAAVQYLIPCILVTASRSHLSYNKDSNILASPFTSRFWVYCVYCWMFVCLVFITLKYVQ